MLIGTSTARQQRPPCPPETGGKCTPAAGSSFWRRRRQPFAAAISPRFRGARGAFSVVSRVAFFVGVFAFCGASDCAPGVGVGEAADCCECLGEHGDDGAIAAPGDNCLPDDISQGFDTKTEIQQCAADAADGIAGGDAKVVADVECREDPHPCTDICAKAAELGVTFSD